MLGLPGELGLSPASSRAARSGRSGGRSSWPASISRRMNVPCERSTPNTSRPVSVWVSKWTMPTWPDAPRRPRARPARRSSGRRRARPGARRHPAPGRPSTSMASCERSTSAGDRRGVAEVDDPQLGEGVDLDLEVRAGRPARGADRARGQPRPRTVGHQVVHRGADDRDVEALRLRRVLRVRRAAVASGPA